MNILIFISLACVVDMLLVCTGRGNISQNDVAKNILFGKVCMFARGMFWGVSLSFALLTGGL